MRAGAYIHIPFCESKCDYCSFYSVAVGKNRQAVFSAYTRSLIEEIRERVYAEGPFLFDTIYFGGGTPSLLGAENIALIIEAVSSCADLEPGAEISLESNPAQLGHEHVSGFLDAGVNRIVAGVQSFDKNFLSFIGRAGRRYDLETIKNFFSRSDLIRSLDLICGPDPAVSAADCRAAVELVPDHISCYMLTVERGTRLGARLAVTQEFESGLAASFEAAVDILKAGGYDHYEISNFSLNGSRSRHNMKYWRFEPYIGFGPSSHSFVNGVRSRNGMGVDEYIASSLAPQIIDERTPEQGAVEYVMTAIRLTDGFLIDDMRAVVGNSLTEKILARVSPIVDSGYLYPDEKKIRLTWKGIMWSDTVAYNLVEDIISGSR